MKRPLMLLGMLLCAAAVQADMIVPRFSLDLPGRYNLENTADSAATDTDSSIALGAEYLHASTESVTLGIGAQYLFDVGIKDYTDKFGFLPVYATILFSSEMQGIEDSVPYVRANIGYNVLFRGNDDFKLAPQGTASLKGGLYWALGIGARFDNGVFTDLMYSSYGGKFESAGVSLDATYTALSLNIGYAFSL